MACLASLPVFLLWISFQLICFGAAGSWSPWRDLPGPHGICIGEVETRQIQGAHLSRKGVFGVLGPHFFCLRSTLVSRLTFEPWHLMMDNQRLTVSIHLFCWGGWLLGEIAGECVLVEIPKANFKLCWSLARIIYAWTTGRQKLPCGKWYLISLETGAPKGKDRQAVCRRWKQGELKL